MEIYFRPVAEALARGYFLWRRTNDAGRTVELPCTRSGVHLEPTTTNLEHPTTTRSMLSKPHQN